MLDDTTTIESIKQKIRIFSDERDWGQFHSPKNLSMAIAAEAAELMELFLWIDSKNSSAELDIKRQEVSHEVADIALYLALFCSRYNIDLSAEIEKKMAINAQKYPITKSHGRWEKYTKL